MAQTTYDLRIAGEQVTSDNCSNLSVLSGVNGTVKYDPDTKTLTLQDATISISGEQNAIVSNIDNLIVKVIGSNNLNSKDWSALRFNKPATITGEGTLNANSVNNSGILLDETNLTIDSCIINANGKFGISGQDGPISNLTIKKNAFVMATGETNGSIVNFTSLNLEGCLIYQPTGAAFDATKKAVVLDGEIVKSRVLITSEPNMERYITLTVADGEGIKLDFIGVDIVVRIVSGSNTTTFFVDDWTGTNMYTADGTEIKVYGDLTGFDCSDNRGKITALDPSHNTQLKWLSCSDNNLTSLDVSHNTQLGNLYCNKNQLTSLDVSKNTKLIGLYCYGNSFSTSAIDDIYCSLPNMTGKGNGVISPVKDSSDTNHATVLATNKQNAIAKNWKVQYYQNNADIPATTGKHKCSATDIAEASAEPALTLYPNPVADVLYLSATAHTVRIYNIYGVEVAHAADTDKVEVSHLPAGIYTVKADGTVAKMVKR